MNFKKILTAAAIAAISAASAYADVFNFDDGTVVLGKTYEVPAFTPVEGQFTAPSTGKLVQDGCPLIKIVGLGDGVFVGFGGANGQVYEWNVQEGVVYHVAGDFLLDQQKVCFTMASDIEIAVVSAMPAVGEVIGAQVNYTGDIIVNFNTAVRASQASLQVGDVKKSLIVPDGYSNMVAVNIRQAMTSLYASGALNPDGGDAITIAIEGIVNSEGVAYNGDGKLVLDYVSAPKAINIISTNVADGKPLKSYYPAGDPAGIFTFVFDGEVAPGAFLTISCGDQEGENYYYEELRPARDDRTLAFDLCGKLRLLNNYLAAQGNNYVAIKLAGVFDTAGFPAEGSGLGNSGSYSYSYVYDYIQPVDITSEFLPATGESLAGVDNIEIWFNHSDAITFDGVKFAYIANDMPQVAIVEKADLSITVEGAETTINVAVPAEVKGQKDVTVTLYNMVSLDGYDHESQIMAEYDKFVAKMISPLTPGNAYATTGEDDFVITINGEYPYVRYDFYNDTWAYGTEFHAQDNGTLTAYNGNYVCYAGKTNYMLVQAYNSEADYWAGQDCVGCYTFYFEGLTKPFEYSTYKFVEISPEPGTELEPTEDFCFIVQFDGLVSIDAAKSGVVLGFGAGVEPFAKIEAANVQEGDPEGYANTWLLYPSANLMDSVDGLTISIYAYDMDGALVEGNVGGGEYDYLSFYYPIYNPSALVELSVLPKTDSVLDELSLFTVAIDGKAVSVNGNYEGQMPYIYYAETLETAYTFADADIEVYADVVGEDELGNPVYSEVSVVNFTVNPAIAEEGSYVLCIPENFLLIGGQFDVTGNAAFWGVYTVSDSGSVSSVVAAGSNRYEVYNLQGIKVLSTERVADLSALPAGIYLINGRKVAVK